MAARAEYRRRVWSDVWHFMPTCQHWPDGGMAYETRRAKPTRGELCNECQAKERRAR